MACGVHGCELDGRACGAMYCIKMRSLTRAQHAGTALRGWEYNLMVVWDTTPGVGVLPNPIRKRHCIRCAMQARAQSGGGLGDDAGGCCATLSQSDDAPQARRCAGGSIT